MKVRLGIVGGTVALALSLTPSALAQEGPAPEAIQPAPVQVEPAVNEASAPDASARGPVPAPTPKPAKMTMRIKGDHDGKVPVGRRITAIGRLRPFVPNQRVKVWLTNGKKEPVKHSRLLKRVGDNVGGFSFSTRRLVEPQRFRVRAYKPLTPAQESAQADSRELSVDFPDLDPGDHSEAVDIFNKLLEKEGYYTADGRAYGDATQRAVLAYRKVNGMKRITNATPGIFRKLARGRGGFDLKWPNGGKHVEVDLSRQVMVLARRGKPQHTFHVSTGAPATPTVQGKFPVYRFEPGLNSHGMYYSVYFHGGYATHGYQSVPTYPASHGCVRNPPPNSVFIYKWLDYGDVFYVYP